MNENVWRVFFVPRLNASVVGSVRDMTYHPDTKTFSFSGQPSLPPLTLQDEGSAPRIATASEKPYDYTLTLHHAQPVHQAYFLGQFLKQNQDVPDDYYYDTILAIKTNILDNNISNYDGDASFEAPSALDNKLLKNSFMGNLNRGQTPPGTLTVTLTDGTAFKLNSIQTNFGKYPHSFWSNGHLINGTMYRLGATFVNQVVLASTTSDVFFGHFQRDPDGICVPGDNTEPFVAIQPPPPPYGDPRAENQ